MHSFRSRARAVALQVLYQEDVNPRETAREIEEFIRGRLKDADLEAFCLSLILGVKRNLGELDAMLSATASNWSLGRMATTDRNLLRLGAYEIVYSDTPDRVAVDEAIELAKRFGSGQSASFINGILDKFIEENRSEAE